MTDFPNPVTRTATVQPESTDWLPIIAVAIAALGAGVAGFTLTTLYKNSRHKGE